MSPRPLHLGNGANLSALWIMVAQKGVQGKASLGTKSELAQKDPLTVTPGWVWPPLLSTLAGSCGCA